MSAQRMINALTFAEVDSRYASDTRRMMRNERFRLQAALAGGDGAKISAAMAEALRVAAMWGVEL